MFLDGLGYVCESYIPLPYHFHHTVAPLMIAVILPYLTIITIAVLIVAVAMILYLNADNDRLSESQFDPNRHVDIAMVRQELAMMTMFGEIEKLDSDHRPAYISALRDVDDFLASRIATESSSKTL